MKGLKTTWSTEMETDLIRMFPTHFNKDIAAHFNLSMRTIIRKARELGLSKEDFFFELRKPVLIKLSVKNRRPNPTKGLKGWFVPGSEKTRYQKGNIPATATDSELVKRIHLKRNETIRRDRLRRKYGMTPLTKMNLK
jgi:hypothetical protein